MKLKNETVSIELKNGTVVHGTIIETGSSQCGWSSHRCRWAVAKVALKKVTVKLDPKTVIEISPDTVEEIKINKPVVNDKKKPNDGSSRKKSQTTLTSILTARSKVACGLNDKPKEQILDIDAAHIDNELAVIEYVEDMYKFYKLVENESRVHDYMDSQPEINERMRAILVDWLIDNLS